MWMLIVEDEPGFDGFLRRGPTEWVSTPRPRPMFSCPIRSVD